MSQPCVICGEPCPARVGRKGRPRMTCSPECRTCRKRHLMVSYRERHASCVPTARDHGRGRRRQLPKPEPVAVAEVSKPIAFTASGRRRMIDPATCERDYTADEREFMLAMETYKRANRRPFPTWSEALEVLRSLGYCKVAEPEAE